MIASDQKRQKARALRPNDFPGGVYPPENKHQSTGEPIGSIPLAEQLVVPLLQHTGSTAIPLVKLGETVLKGQKIAEADGLISCSLHAPTSGKVVAIEPAAVPHPSGLPADCITIDADGEDRWCELQPCEDFRRFTPVELLEKIRDCGISGMGGAGFPTAVKLDPHGGVEIDTLIINGTECEPYITADDMLMRERAEEIIAGVEIISYILDEPERVLIGIEDNKPEAIAAMRAAAEGTRFDIVVFPTKYPSGGEKQLIQILTGREVPNKGLPANVGIVCQNVGTARAVYRAVRFGEPLISRVATVVGKALERQRNIEVPIGTPIKHILKAHGAHRGLMRKVIIGGPMMGYTIDDTSAPVIKTTNCLLVPTVEELPPAPPAQACIRCGFCAEACPASLLPQQLYWYARADDHEKLQAYNLFDCIECGCCSYVCPSSIPLVQYYRAAKGDIRTAEQEKEKADRARERFEFRKLRMERAEKEKQAKREARRKAAELARRQREESGGAEAEAAQKEADLVAAALARVKAKQASPEQQLARAQRSLTSAEGRVERLQQKLEAAEEKQRDQLAAQLKAAELKLQEARQKLAEAERQAETAAEAGRESTPGQDDPQARAQSAIEKAKAAAAARAAMSPAEKLAGEIDALKARVEKARARLEKACSAGDANVEAFEKALQNLQQKLEAKLREQKQAGEGKQ
ncbi:electron transport complex subunit RsxC [Microbulbifer thermotolerans]|uniref:Ion-translocating oxidoreductase complex subunit C n=1 Tax=Microbulbifer thermotolerans TaxID=252514 RepID=A0AB35HVG5_MICTH|nr:electron transport complex subunit RsxC [Microbulbifer thermotolerans]MCX2779474.1 electron transport complex subunit RsxC [Microbulbifer thermotolerans]MCX2801284.1 electron transport complex subunit RsxC [Microbulbifer thermotolerans]MCX2806081.1 electron transport complex subunit RsxC [Microbulbifer thermotolerans]